MRDARAYITHLAYRSLHVAPRAHDVRVVNRDTRNDLCARCLQGLEVLDVAREMCLQRLGLEYEQMRRKCLSCKVRDQDQALGDLPTLLQPGVKAPGTPNKIPFFPANRSLIATGVGFPSTSSTTLRSGRLSPTATGMTSTALRRWKKNKKQEANNNAESLGQRLTARVLHTTLNKMRPVDLLLRR